MDQVVPCPFVPPRREDNEELLRLANMAISDISLSISNQVMGRATSPPRPRADQIARNQRPCSSLSSRPQITFPEKKIDKMDLTEGDQCSEPPDTGRVRTSGRLSASRKMRKMPVKNKEQQLSANAHVEAASDVPINNNKEPLVITISDTSICKRLRSEPRWSPTPGRRTERSSSKSPIPDHTEEDLERACDRRRERDAPVTPSAFSSFDSCEHSRSAPLSPLKLGSLSRCDSSNNNKSATRKKKKKDQNTYDSTSTEAEDVENEAYLSRDVDEKLEEVERIKFFGTRSAMYQLIDDSEMWYLDSRHLFMYRPSHEPNVSVNMRFEDLYCVCLRGELNDTVIEFYLRYLLQTESHKEEIRMNRESWFLFNPFIFAKLRENVSLFAATHSDRRDELLEQMSNNFLSVKTWTDNKNIFDKKYLFMPIMNINHWSMMVVVNPGAVVEGRYPKVFKSVAGRRKKQLQIPDDGYCYLIMLDSLNTRNGVSTMSIDSVFSIVTEYLRMEYNDKAEKFNMTGEFLSRRVKTALPQNLPQQQNGLECGFYMLSMFHQFIVTPKKIDDLTDWQEIYPKTSGNVVRDVQKKIRKAAYRQIQSYKVWRRFCQYEYSVRRQFAGEVKYQWQIVKMAAEAGVHAAQIMHVPIFPDPNLIVEAQSMDVENQPDPASDNGVFTSA